MSTLNPDTNPNDPGHYVTYGPDANCTLAVCPASLGVYEYRPSLPANAIFIALFGTALALHAFQGVKYKTWTFSIIMVSGCVCEMIGYAGRIMLYQNPFSFTGFLMQIICITIAPVFYTAAIYLTLSKIIMYLGPQYARFSPSLYYWIFIPCDILSLVLQAIGGALSSTSTGNSQPAIDVSLAGLSFQVFTLTAFTALGFEYAFRYVSARDARLNHDQLPKSFKIFVSFLSLATVLILIRCIYRIDELSQGYNGPLIHDQGLFIGLEGVMIIVAAFCLNAAQPGPVFGWPKNSKRGVDTMNGYEEHKTTNQTVLSEDMSFGGPGGGQKSAKPIPPERGSFPLDHDGDCKSIVGDYLRCLRRVRGTNDHECRMMAKEYLRCRMENNLMAPDEFKNLGFAEESKGEYTSAPGGTAAQKARQDDKKEPTSRICAPHYGVRLYKLICTMPPHVLPPNPYLVAIVFVVSTRTEPRIVFHYPPKPGEDNSRFKNMFKDDSADDTSSSSSETGESSADETPRSTKMEEGHQGRDSPPEVEETGSVSPKKSDRLGPDQNELRWNDIFGYQSSVLAKLLCPGALYHKKRFEMGLRDNVFVGWPVHSRPDGSWKKKKKMRRLSSKSNLAGSSALSGGGDLKISALKAAFHNDIHASDTSGHESGTDRVDDQGNKLPTENNTMHTDTEHTGDEAKAKAILKAREVRAKDYITMFHVVFVLNPPPLEYSLRIGDMYDNVVKKFSKALKWEQGRSNYVTKEASTIWSTTKRFNKTSGQKAHLATLYHELLSQSTLARAISSLYNSISSSRIAHFNLAPTLSLSLQIPIPTSISTLPNPLTPQLPGLWLTTATSLPNTDTETHHSSPQLGAHFTLLLLFDLRTILADVNAAASPITGPLTHYLRVSKPTKSFQQISQTSGIPLQDIQFLASHLIYWRRAQAIPPLHQRDTYIMSPNADMRNLASSTSAFAKAFPSLPPLPKLLSILSGTPRPYSALIPSKDHKVAYLDILAWLMRGGWVTQLRTFAWVQVPAHIKRAVPEEEKSSESTNPASSSPSSRPPQQPPPEPTTTIHPFPPASTPSTDLPLHHLAALSAHVLRTQGEESQAAWEKCVRYFDGKHALESIHVREGWKRKRVAEFVAEWEGEGVLVRGRHW